MSPIAVPEIPHPGQVTELRALWISRFDWTEQSARPADPTRLDAIVERAAAAGFNALLFQVRAVADAYYASPLEPWAARVSGRELGRAPEPFWDPLTYLVEKAHAAGLQVHAWLNVYPVAEGRDRCLENPDWRVEPMPLFYRLAIAHGVTFNRVNGLQWDDRGEVICASYRYASPASSVFEEHFLAVAADVASRYAVDGLHLDHLRYAARRASCDPVSLRRYYGLPADAPLPPCRLDAAYADWQRGLISATVRRLYQEVARPRSLWLSAAVWPVYRRFPELDRFGPSSQGYHDYYQDSKAWVQGGYMDALMPMIYPAVYNCPDDSFWNREVWRLLVADFQATAGQGFIVPGIGAGYCTFDEIADRIDMARQLGVAGHALFSYRGLAARGYLDELAAGPYATPAVAPALPWR